MRNTLLFFLFAIVVFQLEAQNHKGNSPWIEQSPLGLNSGILLENGLSVNKFKLFELNQEQLSQPLKNVTQFARNGKVESIILPFPTAEGYLQRFKVVPSNTLHPKLAEKFPGIEAYEGIGLDDPSATIRFEITPQGLTGMIWSTKLGTQVIQGLKSDNQSKKYIVYYKKSAGRNHKNHFNCHTKKAIQQELVEKYTSAARQNDGLLRTYRLALAVTAEYTTLYGGTKAGALAAMTTTINRVNGILKRDVAVQLQLVENNDAIIFTNAATDGYTNDDSGAMLDENQAKIDGIIGSNNYDIGHVFSTGNGGVAYLGSVCANGIKAGGVTGSQSPQGDPFDVDYVTHEIGHQFGANHTQNNDCSSTFATSFEPGSGSTIMGYAGICFPNVQSNSDDYFHAISISQIKSFTTGPANNCADKTPTNNSRPTANAGNDYTIPHSTPFELEGIGTDTDNQTLTYSWEQMNNEAATMPPLPTAIKGPVFRSLPPANSNIRQFPSKGSNKDHAPSTWEVLPSVERTLKFRLTVRDNFSGGGSTANDNMEVEIAPISGPFKVLSPNGGEQLTGGINNTIKWDVANSNQQPVNCSAVDIFLSVDGGETYPIVLAENEPNDGSAEVFLQNSMATSNARIKIKGSNNIFFDVSNNNFQIEQSAPGFTLGFSSSELTVCQGEATQVTIDVIGVDGFSGNVNLSTQVPNAFSSNSFSSTTVSTGNTSTLTLNALNTQTPGNYDILVTGVSGDITVTKSLSITIAPQTPATVSLTEPSNNAQDVAILPTFGWNSAGVGATYRLDISTSANFSTLFHSEGNLNGTSYTLPINLENGQVYYWRIQSANQCGLGNYSDSQSFTVTNNLCQTYTNEEKLTISSGQPSTITSPIVITESGQVSTIKVAVDISHSWVGDLTLTLESPSGKKVKLLQEVCGNEDRLTLTFANDGEEENIPCPPVSDLIFVPAETFDVLTGTDINGTWKLLIADGVELDGGMLESWSLEVCRAVSASQPLSVLISNTTNPVCNGSNTGSIQASVNGGTPNYTIAWSNGANQLTLNNLTAGTYEVTVTDGSGLTKTATATLTEPTAIVIEDIVQNARCNGENSGSIQVFPSGGTPGYQYQWANGVRQFNNLNLPDGNYIVTVTDGNGCTKNATYTVTEPSPIELSFSSNNAMDGQNGSLDLVATGGTGDYTYDWSSGATTRDVDGLAPGNFTVVVTDENGCTAEGEASVITENSSQSCYSVTINITLDNYGEENRWELRDGNGQLVQEVGPFNNFENGSVQATNLCIPPGCYDFTIFDLWGDGMCCSYGQGGYEVIEDATGKVLASGGSYNKQETKNVCLPSSAAGLSVIDYCGANGRNTQYEWIETVEIAGQVFNSGDNEGYGDFEDTEVVVPIGGTLDLAFTPGFGFFDYHENWQVWIDFNNDGDFEDEGEAAFLISGNERVTGTIGIPATATAGKTRMRIAMKWGELIEPCESFSWGEVEDYTLNLQGLSNQAERIGTTPKTFITGNPAIYTTQIRGNTLDLNVFPNPAAEYVGLEWEDTDEKDYELFIYNSLGQIQEYQQIVTKEGPNKAKLSVTQLPSGIYLLTLRNKDKLISKEFVVTK